MTQEAGPVFQEASLLEGRKVERRGIAIVFEEKGSLLFRFQIQFPPDLPESRKQAYLPVEGQFTIAAAQLDTFVRQMRDSDAKRKPPTGKVHLSIIWEPADAWQSSIVVQKGDDSPNWGQLTIAAREFESIAGIMRQQRLEQQLGRKGT